MAFLAPLVLAVIIGAAFGRDVSIDTRLGVVDADDSVVSHRILDGVDAEFASDGSSAGDSPVTTSPVESIDAARQQIADGDLDAAIVIPSGFGASLVTDEPEPLRVVVDARKTIAADVAHTVALSITSSVDLARTTASVDQHNIDITLREVTGRYEPVTYFAPAMAILFMFLTLGSGARSMIVERDEGTLTRLRSIPVSTGSILVGKAIGVVVVGSVAMIVMWITTTVAFGADWGDPVAVAMVSAATVVAVTGVSFLITGVARSDAQADGLVSMVAFVLALLGGNFVQPNLMPDVLARLALFTPNGWALRAFTDIGADGAGPAQVLPAVAVLVAMAVVTATIGLAGVRRKIAGER